MKGRTIGNNGFASDTFLRVASGMIEPFVLLVHCDLFDNLYRSISRMVVKAAVPKRVKKSCGLYAGNYGMLNSDISDDIFLDAPSSRHLFFFSPSFPAPPFKGFTFCCRAIESRSETASSVSECCTEKIHKINE